MGAGREGGGRDRRARTMRDNEGGTGGWAEGVRERREEEGVKRHGKSGTEWEERRRGRSQRGIREGCEESRKMREK